MLTSWTKDLQGSRYLRGDCLKIECTIDEDADVFIHVGAAEPFPAHSSVLDAYAPRFLKKHGLGIRHRKPKHAMRVNVDDMPRPAVAALLQFVYTNTLPVVRGLSGDGYRDMFWHLLLAAKCYGVRSRSAICEPVLSECIDVETAAATLAMAHRQGFEKLKEACFEFMTDPCIFELVQETKGYFELEC
ncbi:hypothetical protein BAE44_0021847 [Dichanthelium oligosanthes]|uniref:BTB domain-containing protein n=1 Tax=Dichanthelium oligosanthes TaxID=888268 RepID=A0A1E5UWA0_9POAL|nr:hypothetical protein BAE44_0021847 [Dichanthelium oligosanthes]